MMEGKVRAALRTISENNNGGLMNLDCYVVPDSSETVREALMKKHPTGKPLVPSAIISENLVNEPRTLSSVSV